MIRIKKRYAYQAEVLLFANRNNTSLIYHILNSLIYFIFHILGSFMDTIYIKERINSVNVQFVYVNIFFSMTFKRTVHDIQMNDNTIKNIFMYIKLHRGRRKVWGRWLKSKDDFKYYLQTSKIHPFRKLA